MALMYLFMSPEAEVATLNLNQGKNLNLKCKDHPSHLQSTSHPYNYLRNILLQLPSLKVAGL
jgi:hypothetical protein